MSTYARIQQAKAKRHDRLEDVVFLGTDEGQRFLEAVIAEAKKARAGR